eukprot:TRINITY_DN300_c0_g3_i1.p1 TRINITY_DN300_c0_g3~~TRINITY_DN300_c0_g3_i1.p1  ORF type:complete len:299 (+),score=58.26 TRINITY_DN300_c0_g3_i1:50-898(+)
MTGQHTRGSKHKVFGVPLENVYLMTLQNHESLKDFKARVPGAIPVERFVGKDLLFFQDPCLTPGKQSEIRAKPKVFKQEIRNSRVLILTIKGKATLTLEEGLQIVAESPLRGDMDLIELIAVNPKTFKPKEGVEPWDMMVHVYIQFATEEDARSRVNTVDAMRYKDYYVHSPQCDEHQMFYPDSGYQKSDYIWTNTNKKSVVTRKVLLPTPPMTPLKIPSLPTVPFLNTVASTPDHEESEEVSFGSGSSVDNSAQSTPRVPTLEPSDPAITWYSDELLMSFY